MSCWAKSVSIQKHLRCLQQNVSYLGHNSGTGILQNIMDANGTGLICETEADTLASAISSEYGHWSDTLRKAFDHDRLSYNRRTDQEYREVKRIFLAVLLSGTPGTSESPHPVGGERTFLPPTVLLHAWHLYMG